MRLAGRGADRGGARRWGGAAPLALLFLLDLAGVAVVTGLFCLFYFMLPRELDVQPVTLPAATTTAAPASASPSVPSPPPAATTAPGNGAGGGNETPAPAATPAGQGMWGGKFADRFAPGDPEITDTSYKSRDVSVTIEKKESGGVVWYVADVYVRNLSNFRTSLAKGKYGKGITDSTLNMANEANAVVALSGDYYGFHETGIVVRNGMLWRKTPLEDVMVMGNDGVMRTYADKDFNADDALSSGLWQAWSFGPMLLDADGRPMDKFNSTLNPANPRAAIGYWEPGHYCLVVVDGRQPGYSAGITLKGLSQLFADMGCKAAYNLDGGQTAVMTFMGKWVNRPYKNGRNVSDIVYVGEAD